MLEALPPVLGKALTEAILFTGAVTLTSGKVSVLFCAASATAPAVRAAFGDTGHISLAGYDLELQCPGHVVRRKFRVVDLPDGWDAAFLDAAMQHSFPAIRFVAHAAVMCGQFRRNRAVEVVLEGPQPLLERLHTRGMALIFPSGEQHVVSFHQLSAPSAAPPPCPSAASPTATTASPSSTAPFSFAAVVSSLARRQPTPPPPPRVSEVAAVPSPPLPVSEVVAAVMPSPVPLQPCPVPLQPECESGSAAQPSPSTPSPLPLAALPQADDNPVQQQVTIAQPVGVLTPSKRARSSPPAVHRRDVKQSSQPHRPIASTGQLETPPAPRSMEPRQLDAWFAVMDEWSARLLEVDHDTASTVFLDVLLRHLNSFGSKKSRRAIRDRAALYAAASPGSWAACYCTSHVQPP